MAEDYIKMLCENIRRQFEQSGIEKVCESYTKEVKMLSMRDGVSLYTVIYKPQIETGKFPVILTRTCYPDQEKMYCVNGEEFTKKGYAYVFQYSRGRGASEGEWIPNVNERQDGIDTVNWLKDQEWCDTLGYWGASYTSLAGWAMADAVEGKVASMFLEHYGTDRFTSAYEKGAFRHDVLTSWSMDNAKNPIDADYLESCRYMPQIEVDEKLWGERVDTYRNYISNTRESDAYWQSGWWKMLREIPSKTKVPIYLMSGWYDHHHGSSMKTWENLNEEAKKHSWLEIGGWNHFMMPCLPDKKIENIESEDIKKLLSWFEMTLKEKKIPKQYIRMYQIGEDRWEELPEWPLQKDDEAIFYLTGKEGEKKGTLVVGEPEKAVSFCYVYDPENPVETVSGDGLLKTMNKIGSLLQPDVSNRRDVIRFQTEPLEKSIAICGKIALHLYVKTDVDDTAFTAKIMEVTEEGKAYHIRSSISTIAHELPEDIEYQKNEMIEIVIEMWDIAYTIQKGSKIRIDISSSDFPQYNIHSNYKGTWSEQIKVRKANQTILTGKDTLSRVILPVRN